MTNPPPSPAARHPLEDDLERLELIVDVMWAQIHRVIHRNAPRRRRTGSGVARVIGEPVAELRIQGGHSTEDILSECLKALLTKPPEQVTESWEAVAFGIATNKTKGALRDGQAWLRATDHRPKLTIVSGDDPGPEGPDGTAGHVVFEGIAAAGPDLEEQFFATAQQLELTKLVYELLDERDRTIFLGLHTGERSRESLANEFDLSPPGVTYVYRRIANKLYDHPRFQRFAQGGTR